MSFNVSAWSIQRPLPAVLIFILLCAAGLIGFHALPIARYPDVAFPMIAVTVTQSGATPSQLEAEVARKIEDSVASLNGVKRVFSNISDGLAVVSIEFQLNRDLNEVLDEVRDAVTRVRADLPRDSDEPIIAKIDFVGGSMLTYSVGSDSLGAEELSWFVDREVSRALYGVKGVALVKRSGGVEREVTVTLAPSALASYGITAGQVSQQLTRIQVERSGGRSRWAGGEQAVRAVGTVDSAAALKAFPIALGDGRSVRLEALARISDGPAEPRQRALLDGIPVVAFSISRSRGAGEVGTARAIEAKVAELAAANPQLRFTRVASTVEEAENSYSSSMTMLWEGSLLAVLVVWWFLRDLRATWISAVALPLSIIPTFAVMAAFGFSLNLITLLALAVVVGILVDDAIVEVENIDRHLAMGKPPKQAAFDAADEIGLAVIATSMTLAAVFVPVAFMPGIPGKFFREFGWTAATAVLFSLLVARLLTPMMAAYQLRAKLPETRGGRRADGSEIATDSALMRWYLRWVRVAIAHRGRTLWLATALFVASIGIVPLIPSTFIPPSDLGRSNLGIELAPGASLEDTVAAAEAARASLIEMPELASVYTTVGDVLDLGDPSKTGMADVRKATLILNWVLPERRSRNQRELERQVRQRVAALPGMRTSFISSEPGDLLQLVLAGDEPRSLTAAARDLERELRQISGLGAVTSSAALLRPELVITPDPARAADLGVNTEDIGEAARIASTGDIRQRLAKLNLADRQLAIRVRLSPEALRDPAQIALLPVPSKNGPVPLSAVATIRQDAGPAQIDRFQRQRNIMLTAELNGRPLGEVMAEVEALPTRRNLPPGVFFLNSGDAEIFVELFTGFLMAMAAGLFCIYAVLLLLFNHPLQPLTILAAVPLCAGGAFGSLLLFNHYLSLPALIGLLMLIGIATKNSILLVDYAVIAEHEFGLEKDDALVDACHKRARPVLMTSIAMSAGMLPLALGFGADASFRQPMAVAVIGGLFTSTLLSLVVVPAAFSLMEDIGRRFGIRGGRIAAAA